jgi:hypothetical protein
MDTNVKQIAESGIEVFDAHGRLIGTITRPVAPDVLGPGREKVYLARRRLSGDRASQAA